MGTNFNPNGLRTFAEMGFQPQFNINVPQNPAAQAPIAQPQMQPQMQAPGQSAMVQPAANNTYPQSMPAAQNNQNLPNTNLEKTPKQDTVTIAGKEIKKRNVIITGLGLAAAAVAAGVLVFRGKQNQIPMPDDIKAVHGAAKGLMNRARGIFENAKLFKEEGTQLGAKASELAENIQETAKKVHDKISDVLNLSSQPDSAVKDAGIVRRMFHDNNINRDIMEEYAPDGVTVIRKSYFNTDNYLDRIVEILPDGKQNIISFAAKGKISSYEEGMQQIADKIKTDKILLFENGAVFKYKQGHEISPNTEKAEIVLDLVGGKPQTYMEGYEKIVGNTTIEKIKKALDFKEGSLKKYKEDVEIEDSSIFKIKKKYNYEKDKYQENYEGNYLERTETRGKTAFLMGDNISKYEEGVVCVNDRPVSIQGMMAFVQGKPDKYYGDIKISDTDVRSIKKGIHYRKEVPSTYMEDFEIAEGKIASFKRKVSNNNGVWTENSESGSAA